MSDDGPSHGSPSSASDEKPVDFASVAGLDPDSLNAHHHCSSMTQKKCSKCGVFGHNKRTCTQQPPYQDSRSSASAEEDQSANGSNADEIRQDAANANGEKEVCKVTLVQFREWLLDVKAKVPYDCFQGPARGKEWWRQFQSNLPSIRSPQLGESMAMKKLKEKLDDVCSFLLVQKAEHKQRLQDFKDRSDVNAGMLQEYATAFSEIVRKEWPKSPQIPFPGPRGQKGRCNGKTIRDQQQGAQIDQNPGTESDTDGGDDVAAGDDRSQKRPRLASLADDTGGGSSSRNHAGTSGPGCTDDAGPSQGKPCKDCAKKKKGFTWCSQKGHHGPNGKVKALNDTSDSHAQSFECAQCKSSTEEGNLAVFLQCCGVRVCTTRSCRSPEECASEECKTNKPPFEAHWLPDRTTTCATDGCITITQRSDGTSEITQRQAVGHCAGCKKDLCKECRWTHQLNDQCSDEGTFPVGANVNKDYQVQELYCESHKEFLTFNENYFHGQDHKCFLAKKFEEEQGWNSVPGMADLRAHKEESINLLREGDEVADFVKNKTGEELQKRKAADKKLVADLKTELLQWVESCAGAAESRIEGSYSSELASSELAESRMKEYKQYALCHSNLVAQDELVLKRAASDSRERALPLVQSKKYAHNLHKIKAKKLKLDEVKQSLICLPPATDPPPVQAPRDAIEILFTLVGARPKPAPSPAQPAPPDNTAQTTSTPSGVGGSGGAGRSGAAGAGGLIAVATAGNTQSHDTQSLPPQLSARSRPSSPDALPTTRVG